MDGSSVVLHTRFSNVVFPAFALPITRTRKRVYFSRSFAASFWSIVTAGVGAAGGVVMAGGAADGAVTAGRAAGGAVTAGGATTIEGELERF